MSQPATAAHSLGTSDLKRLEAYLRRALRCETLSLAVPAHRGATIELQIAGEVLGTVDQVDEDGERSWAVTIIVLEDDLPAQ